MVTTSAKSIQHHYDLSNEYYKLWLDKRMVYSCALWDETTKSLEQSQINKLRYHARAIEARENDRILDVGCGWGAMLRLLLDECRVKAAIGLTLSEAQMRYIEKNFSYDSLNVILSSWEQYRATESFDGIISVGAFEHFARQDQTAVQRALCYRNFFDFCRYHLQRGRYLSLKTITYGRMRKLPKFIKEKIWPESQLPTVPDAFQKSGLHLLRIKFRKTCR